MTAAAIESAVVYWHYILGYSKEIKLKLYSDGMTMLLQHIMLKNRAFFFSICNMSKSTHYVPPPHMVPHSHKVKRYQIEHSIEHADNVSTESANTKSAEKRRTSHTFNIIYSNLSGIALIPSISNIWYYMTFIDDFTKMTCIVFLKDKPAAKQAICEVIAQAERQYNAQIKHFFMDNRTE